MRILLADDNESVRRGLREFLSAQEDLVVCGEAVDGIDALEKAKELNPDAVLMDISMPRMDGLSATRILRRELPKTKVIIVTQNDPSIVRGQAAEVGADGCVEKANLSWDLLPTFERVFDRRIAKNGEHRAAESKAAPWIAGGGIMSAVMRTTDWSKTPLGTTDTWSPALRMMVPFLLANRFPQLLWWGPQFCCLYNDAYAPILGTKHPWAVGRPVSEVWHEIWHILEPLIETPFRGGPATWMEDIALEINRRDFIEETHFTIAYSPVPDESVPGGIGGVLATVHEITEKIVGERRVSLLRDLGAQSDPTSSADACRIAADTLTRHSKDVPFVLFYLLDDKQDVAHLICGAGVDLDDRGCPETIKIVSDNSDGIWPFSEAFATQEIQDVSELETRFQRIPEGPWADPPNTAAVLPIRSNIPHQLVGFMVVGISSRLRFDKSYRDFLELMSTQIATTLANARAYEEERKRAESLAEIDRAKTAFFSNVSHEFRTPLTLMLGPLQDLLSRSQTHLSPTAKEQLELVNRNGARLLRLVNTLLDFSRIEAGRMQAVYQATDLGRFTAELASVFRSATERVGLELSVDCDSLGEPAYVDRDMWEKIVLNLISNAFKFTFEGVIAVSVKKVGNSAELRVRDTGVGIPTEGMPKLFERFHRIPNTRSRTYEGSGIGLALVQELVKLHSGSIRAESTPERGTTFIVSVPLGQDHLAAEQIGGSRNLSSTAVGAMPFVEEALRWLPDTEDANKQEVPQLDELLPVPCPPVFTDARAVRPHVIVADDNSDMRQYLTRLLAEHYEIQAVADGEAALAASRERIPDLILSDVMMPKLDGLGLLRELRADPGLKDIPIVLLSARAGEESRLKGVEAGADDYLVKPFSARELVARVEAHVKMYRLRQQAKVAQQRLTADYETVLNQAPMGIYLIDSEFRIRQVNPIALLAFGPIPNLIGRDFREVLRIHWTEEYADEIARIFRHTLETGEPYSTPESAEHRVDRGTTDYYAWRIDRIALPEGGYGVVCYFRDISVQVKARMALADSEERYRSLAGTLEEQVLLRTNELTRQSEEVRRLSTRLLRLQDEERRHIARELHDSVGQELTVAKITLEAARRKTKLGECKEIVADAAKTLELALQQMRSICYVLHPPTLDQSGLRSAVGWLVEGVGKRSGIETSVEIEPSDFPRVRPELEMAVFRMIQEALSNVLRHSQASKASVSLAQRDGKLIATIRDNGKGLTEDELHPGKMGVGISGMRQRAREFGGELRLQRDNPGTIVEVTIPVEISAATREPLSAAIQ